MNKRAIEGALGLFGAVPEGPVQETNFAETIEQGIVIDGRAAYARQEILAYYQTHQLSDSDLNASFHKSWKVIRDSSRSELLVHQILHYLSTYGSNFNSEFVYFPAEKLELPELGDVPVRMVRGLPEQELIDKCMDMLKSGVALKEETIDALLDLLDALGHEFTSVESIRNKEAVVRIIAQTGLYPDHPVEFLRYLLYKATESSLLIKNDETIKAIRDKKLNVAEELDRYGLARCAEVFLRFKPLWLAFKTHKANIPKINEIGRLARRHHKPLPLDVLNSVTAIEFSTREVKDALARANNFRKARLLNALNTRLNQPDAFLYRVRNGKSWAAKNDQTGKQSYFRKVFDLVYADLLASLDLKGKRILYPELVDYALPSTEKMFVGNFPAGTKITTNELVAGIYWKNEWGASDLDLSSLSLEGKVGWNSSYKQGGLMYSGDITDAPFGATELLYTAGSQLAHPALAINNIYSGKEGCKFKIIVGSAPEVDESYVFSSDELILEAESNMVGRQQILGIFLPEADKKLSFVLVNAGFGSMSVSGNSAHSDAARQALFYQFSKPISFRKLLEDAGAEVIPEGEADLDLRPQHLEKDTLIGMLG